MLKVLSKEVTQDSNRLWKQSKCLTFITNRIHDIFKIDLLSDLL